MPSSVDKNASRLLENSNYFIEFWFSFIMFELNSAFFSWKLLWQFEFKSHSNNLMVIMYPMGNDFKMSQTKFQFKLWKNQSITSFNSKKNCWRFFRALISKQSGFKVHFGLFFIFHTFSFRSTCYSSQTLQ